MPYDEGVFYYDDDDLWDRPSDDEEDEEFWDDYDATYEVNYTGVGSMWWTCAYRGTSDILRAEELVARLRYGVTQHWRRHWRYCHLRRYPPCAVRRKLIGY